MRVINSQEGRLFSSERKDRSLGLLCCEPRTSNSFETLGSQGERSHLPPCPWPRGSTRDVRSGGHRVVAPTSAGADPASWLRCLGHNQRRHLPVPHVGTKKAALEERGKPRQHYRLPRGRQRAGILAGRRLNRCGRYYNEPWLVPKVWTLRTLQAP